MKQPIKLLFAVLGVGSVIALALFSWSVKAKSDTTFQLANGIQVTPLEVKPDDTLMLLDAKIWKFEVVVPDATKAYNYTLNLCQNGKVLVQLGGVGSAPAHGEGLPRHIQVTVGMVPIDDAFSKAQRVKYGIRVSGGGSNGVFSNPFGSGFGYSETPKIFPSDNLIYLMSGNKDGLPSDYAVSIALKIEPLQVKR